jgi:hypothetical protein
VQRYIDFGVFEILGIFNRSPHEKNSIYQSQFEKDKSDTKKDPEVLTGE